MAKWKQKRQHMLHYNSTAHLYNMRYAQEQNLKIRAVIQNLKLERENSILDLGCGTGLLISKTLHMTKNIVGIDISRNMLKVANLSIMNASNVHFILADADHTPLRENAFDTVFAITLLQNMPNPHCTLQEMKCVAKPNASIIVTGFKKYFTKHSFLKILKNAKMRIELLVAEDSLKCFIATCHKM